MTFECYIVTNLLNDKQYVGITSQGVAVRWQHHICASRRPARAKVALYGAIRQYGEQSFRVDHIASCATYDDLLAIEQIIISQERTIAPGGYNLTAGGEGMRGYTASAVTKEKQAAAHRGRAMPWSTWESLVGRECRADTRAKIAAAQKGRPVSPERVAKRAATVAQRYPDGITHRTPEGRARLSAALAARNKMRWALS